MVPQALHVLEEMERLDLVTKAPKKNQWSPTPKGHQLTWYWHPPPVRRPIIEYEPAPGSINVQLEAVPCSIWRGEPDDDEMFEEGEIDVGVFVDYEHDRLIEINITQNDQYQGETGPGVCVSSVYISAADARVFLKGLQEAIQRAEKDSALRVTANAARASCDEAAAARRRVKENAEAESALAVGGAAGPASPQAKSDERPARGGLPGKTRSKPPR